MSVANEILKARTERRLTKADLAKQLGVHPSFVTQLEKGAVRPSLNLLSQLGKVLGLDPEKLLIQSGHIPPRFSAVAESSPGLILSFLQDGTSTLREPTGAYLTNQAELCLETEAKDPYSRLLPK